MIFWFIALLVSTLFGSPADAASARKQEDINTSIPGLTRDGVCDDRCIDYLKFLTHAENKPPWREVYFSCADGGAAAKGSDTNPGTPESPMLTFEKLEDIANRGEVIIYVDEDTCVDTTSGGALEGFDGFQFNPPDCGERICTYIEAWNPDSPATLDCSELSLDGSTGEYPVLITQQVEWAGINLNHCPREPVASGSATSSIAFGSTGTGTVPWIAINTNIDNAVGSHAHLFKNTSTPMQGFNVGGSFQQLAIFDEDCSTAGQVSASECADQLTTPLSLCDTTADPYGACTLDSGAGDSQLLGYGHGWETTNPKSLLITHRSWEYKNTQDQSTNGPFCFLSDASGDSPFIGIFGGSCIGPATTDETESGGNNAGYFTMLQPNDGTTAKVYVVGLLGFPFSSGLGANLRGFRTGGFNASASASFVDFYLRQSTITGVNWGINESSFNTTDHTRITGRCNIFDELNNGPIDFADTNSESPHEIDFDGTNVYDVDEAATSFIMRSETYANAQSVSRSDPTAQGWAWTINDDFFGSTEGVSEGSLESGGSGVDGNSFSGTSGDLTTASMCGDGQECDTDCTEPVWTIQLPEALWIDETLTKAGVTIKTLKVGTHNKRTGAL